MRPPGIPVIEKILTHLGLQARAPWRQPVARRCKRSDVANPNRSGDPATRAAGAARVREFAGPMTAVWGPVITLEKRPKQDDSRLGRPNPTDHQQITNRSQPVPKDRFKRFGRCVPPRFCRVRVPFRKEKGRLKSLSSPWFSVDSGKRLNDTQPQRAILEGEGISSADRGPRVAATIRADRFKHVAPGELADA